MGDVYINAIINGLVNFALFGAVVLIRRIINKEGIASFMLQRDKKGWLLLCEGIAPRAPDWWESARFHAVCVA
jgi:hypothetical protein